jgi:hypothetical protein
MSSAIDLYPHRDETVFANRTIVARARQQMKWPPGRRTTPKRSHRMCSASVRATLVSTVGSSRRTQPTAPPQRGMRFEENRAITLGSTLRATRRRFVSWRPPRRGARRRAQWRERERKRERKKEKVRESETEPCAYQVVERTAQAQACRLGVAALAHVHRAPREQERGPVHPQVRVHAHGLHHPCQILPLPISRCRFKFQRDWVWDLIKPISNFAFNLKQKFK